MALTSCPRATGSGPEPRERAEKEDRKLYALAIGGVGEAKWRGRAGIPPDYDATRFPVLKEVPHKESAKLTVSSTRAYPRWF